MKQRAARTGVTILVFLVGLTGCLSRPGTPTNYYVLEFDGSVAGAPPERPAAEVAGPAVIVQDAEVASMFDRRQLLQRLEGPLVRYRSGELWAVSPSTAVAELVREGVERSPHFGSVNSGRRAAGRYEVTVRIDALTHYCCDRVAEGEVAGELALLDLRTGRAVIRHSFERREELADEVPRTFVEAVARLLSEEVVAFLDKVPDELE
ncbi:MAG: ABC-type transport auxiliary lipoprotein family protein [Spirochaetaceae bacterium]